MPNQSDLIVSGLFHSINHNHFNGPFGGSETQAEILDGGKDGGEAGIRGLIGGPRQVEIKLASNAGLVRDRTAELSPQQVRKIRHRDLDRAQGGGGVAYVGAHRRATVARVRLDFQAAPRDFERVLGQFPGLGVRFELEAIFQQPEHEGLDVLARDFDVVNGLCFDVIAFGIDPAGCAGHHEIVHVESVADQFAHVDVRTVITSAADVAVGAVIGGLGVRFYGGDFEGCGWRLREDDGE